MKRISLFLFAFVVFTGCSKDKVNPAPASLLGFWSKDSWQTIHKYGDGTPTSSYTATYPHNREQAKFTADSVQSWLGGAVLNKYSYTYQDSILTIEQQSYPYNKLIVKKLTENQLVLIARLQTATDYYVDITTYNR